MLKLKLKYFSHVMWRTNSLKKTLMLGRIEGRGRRVSSGWDGWMASPTQWPWVWAISGRWWRIGNPGMLQSMESQRVRHDWVTEQQHYVFIFIYKFSFLHSSTHFYINIQNILHTSFCCCSCTITIFSYKFIMGETLHLAMFCFSQDEMQRMTHGSSCDWQHTF